MKANTNYRRRRTLITRHDNALTFDFRFCNLPAPSAPHLSLPLAAQEHPEGKGFAGPILISWFDLTETIDCVEEGQVATAVITMLSAKVNGTITQSSDVFHMHFHTNAGMQHTVALELRLEFHFPEVCVFASVSAATL